MRQRKVKDLEEKMQAVSAWLVEEPSPEVWDLVFAGRRLQQEDIPGEAETAKKGTARDLYVEIGCGKGDFILQHALAHPESDYVGIEGQASVVLRAMEKAAAIAAGGDLENVRFACAFVNGMDEFFAPGSLAGVYLNFSDPWPKGRHAKRRLTYRGRLQDYARALRPGGFIAFKTDNDPLFDFTLEEIAACGWTPAEMTRDLHGDGLDLQARQFMTEYEKKFHAAGKHINYVKIIV